MRFPMTTIYTLALAGGVFLTAPAERAHAQPGTVLSHQKISDTQGGFTGMLADSDSLGRSVASLGDLNGDGVDDIAVGAAFDDDGGLDRGAVWVLFLEQDGTVKSEQKISDTQGGFGGSLDDKDFFGRSLASLGDLDGDGVGDLAVGAWGDDDGSQGPCDTTHECGRGAVWILFLNADGTVKSEQKISDTHGNFEDVLDDGDNFGWSVAALGDLDGDGAGDIAVGTPADDDGGMTLGAVWILFLNSNGTVKSEQKISATAGGFGGILDESRQFGWSVASLGDLDGDGANDLAVGVFRDSDGGPFRGAVWVLFLNSDGTVKSHQKISDTQGGFGGTLDDLDHFGDSVASLGDLDGDGVGDLAVGARFDDDGGTNRGTVWVLFLEQDGTVKSEQKISDTAGGFTGVLDNGDGFSVSVGSLGDLNGDGIADLAVGAIGDDDGGLNRGAVWVLFLDGILTDCDGDIDDNGQVTLCHTPPGNPDNARTITVNANAVAGHLAHGDTCGPCGGQPPCNPSDPSKLPDGQTVWYVDDNTCPASGSGTKQDPFCLIQDCIAEAVNGDACVVSPGTYFETINFLGKAITLRSSEGPEVTIIDASGLGQVSTVVCNTSEGCDTVLDGFTITGGIGTTFDGIPAGGGMHNSGSSPTVANCTFSGNTGFFGGGMFNLSSEATVINCTFAGNHASRGGGMHNTGGSPTVSGCLFSGNTAEQEGGGMKNSGGSPSVSNCMFIGNTVTEFSGGGMSNSLSSPTVTNCTFTGNTANLDGGGISNRTSIELTMTNCTFSGNIADNGRALAFDSFPDHPNELSMSNCVLWDGGSEVWINDNTTIHIAYSDVQGGWPGVGNIDLDPLFIDANGPDGIPGTPDDNLRLSPGSPAIDAADNTAVPSGSDVTDLDGNPRFVDDPDTPDTGNPDGINPIVDMGAYEFQDPCADNDGDGQVTICHKPNSGNPQTMSVNQNNLPAHLGHGDHCGPCE